MKRIVKRVAAGLGILVGLVVVGGVVRFYGLAPRTRPPQDVKVPTSAEAIKHGEYIATNVAFCVTCHSEAWEAEPGQPVAPGAKIGAGRAYTKYKQYPTPTGAAWAPNLTPSKQFGIGTWSDGEVLRAMREGVDRNGKSLFHMMGYKSFRQMSDDDALSVVAYLRSLPPVDSDPGGRTQLNFPVSMLVRSIPAPLDGPVPPPGSDPLARGNYLLTIGLCHQCHDGLNKMHLPVEGRELSGGFPMHFPRGTIHPANISSDKETGIGSYSDEDILRAVTQGITKSGRKIYLMPFPAYAGMTKDDLAAIVVALRASKPVRNIVPPPELHEIPADVPLTDRAH